MDRKTSTVERSAYLHDCGLMVPQIRMIALATSRRSRRSCLEGQGRLLLFYQMKFIYIYQRPGQRVAAASGPGSPPPTARPGGTGHWRRHSPVRRVRAAPGGPPWRPGACTGRNEPIHGQQIFSRSYPRQPYRSVQNLRGGASYLGDRRSFVARRVFGGRQRLSALSSLPPL